MFPTSSYFTVLLFSFFVSFYFHYFKHWRTVNIHMNIPCKLLSPPVLVDSTRFSLYAVTEVSRKPKHTHFLCAVFPRSGGEMELRGFDSAKGLPWRCRARHGGVRQSARHWFGLLRISQRSATTQGGGGTWTAIKPWAKLSSASL